MIKRLLVLLGRSKSSISAMKVALELSKHFKADLDLLHIKDRLKIKTSIFRNIVGSAAVYDKKKFLDNKKEVETEAEKEEKFARKLYHKYKKKAPHKCFFTVKEGFFTDEVLKRARLSDLIILGKSIKKDKNGKITGTIFDVIKEAHRPMFVVNSGNYTPGKNFLIAYDGSDSASKALYVLSDFVYFLAPSISVLTVNSSKRKADEIMKECETYFSSYNITINKIWKNNDVAKSVLNTIKEKNISTVIMGAYGDNYISDLLPGKSTLEVLEKAEIPMIITNV